MHGRQKQFPTPVDIGGKNNLLTMENLFAGYINAKLDKHPKILQA